MVVVLLLALSLGGSARGQRPALSEDDMFQLLRSQERIASALEDIGRSLDRIAEERHAP